MSYPREVGKEKGRIQLKKYSDPELTLALLKQKLENIERSLKSCKDIPAMWEECQQLKRERLKLKDEIVRIERSMAELADVQSEAL